jgi:hypothetical protein
MTNLRYFIQSLSLAKIARQFSSLSTKLEILDEVSTGKSVCCIDPPEAEKDLHMDKE